jgi:hypothetical protein
VQRSSVEHDRQRVAADQRGPQGIDCRDGGEQVLVLPDLNPAVSAVQQQLERRVRDGHDSRPAASSPAQMKPRQQPIDAPATTALLSGIVRT